MPFIVRFLWSSYAGIKIHFEQGEQVFTVAAGVGRMLTRNLVLEEFICQILWTKKFLNVSSSQKSLHRILQTDWFILWQFDKDVNCLTWLETHLVMTMRVRDIQFTKWTELTSCMMFLSIAHQIIKDVWIGQ